MRPIFFFLVVFCAGGCLSVETKILSRKIANSSQAHHQELLDLNVVKPPEGKTLFDTKEWKAVVKRAAKLRQVTSGLADILGAPKIIPMEDE